MGDKPVPSKLRNSRDLGYDVSPMKADCLNQLKKIVDNTGLWGKKSKLFKGKIDFVNIQIQEPSVCDNHRGIFLLYIAYKVFLDGLYNWLTSYARIGSRTG